VRAAQGDAAGEAKAHFVHALVFRRLGKIGACEAALDRALAAARRVAGDRRRANSVLAIAPLAALWGPSPVTRASGRCLDVVRVLRITQGAPAVEAVALSCQGVLEALRGRTDAAHRMIASARKMVEELGITQRLLEADVFGAQVELLEGDAPAAERSLLAAYHGLRELGLGIDAARAAALLARALLAQDRVAEAEALSHESEVLAGDDLKAAIAWRGVRAEALARRGEHAAAVEFANRAVELASATDALLDHADARLALAAALRAAGRGREADAEERRAHELWEAKGATLLAERARGDGARAVIAPAAEKSGAEDLTARRRVRANSATAALARILAAFDARDSVALRATYHENSLCIDHPTGSTYGVDEGVAGMVALFRSDGAYYRGEPLATLGESLLLFRRWSGARSTGAGRYDVGEYEAERFHVVEADASGCMVRMEIFAADHLNDAIDCLYARYAQQLPEGPVRTRIAKVAECMAIMLSAPNELERLARLLAPDLECIDHRHLSLWSGRGAELFLEQRRAVHQVAEDVSFTTQEILALEPDAMLSRVMHSGTEREGGGAYERPFLAIVVFDAEGRMGRLEWFDDDREADALARFDRLSAAPTSAPATRSRTHPNLGTAMNDRFMRAFSTGDFDAFRSAIHPNCRVTDHPTGSSYGVDGAIASMQRLFRSRDPFYQIETLATLGRTLVLSRRRLGSSGDIRGSYDVGAYESEALDVSEVDEDGRTTAIDIFAADQLSDAISCLYARRAEQLPTGAARERAQATARSVATTLGRFDERRYTDAFRSDCEIVDHRLLGFGREAGPDRLIRSIAQASVVGTQVVGHSLDALALSESGLLVRWRTSGLGRESGGEFEWVFLRLFGFDSDGRIAHYELFDDDREAEALARFERLTAGASRTPAAANRLRENAAIAAAKRMAAALRSRDFSALEAVLGEAMTAIDHRWHASYGRDGVVETCRRFMQPNDVSFRTDPIATLGEDLSISRQFITAGGSTAGRFDVGEHETEYLSLSEVDRSGVFQRMEFFAADRLGVAVARLYERHAERLPEGSERDRAAATASSVAVWIGPIDADRIATAVAPNVESIDHRTLASWSARGADEFLGYWRLQGDITEGAALRIDAVLAVADNAILDRRIYHGTGRDTGGAFENWVLGLWVFGADGLLTRVEVWEPDAEAAALARFDAVVDRADAREDPFANAASRANRRRTDCFNARDWAGIEACIAPDFAFDERRRLLRNTADRETWLAQTRLLFDVPDSRFAIELLATRGERLSLHLHRFAGTVAGGGGPLAVDDHLALHEVDEGGRIVATLLFDLEDESAAYAELDARFERGEAAAYPRAVKMIVARTHLDATRDWQAYAATLAPGFAYRDHRLLGWGSEGHDAQTLIRMQQSAVEVAPDARYRQDHVRVAQRGVLRRTTLVGTREGGAFENPMLTVHEADDQGRSVRVDSYDIDDLDRALARFAELSAPAPAQSRHSQSPFANTATRALARSAAAWEAQDWDRFGANLPAHFRASDRRRAVQLELDRDQWIAFVRSVGDMQSTRMRVELLATRGDRLALTQIWIELAGDDLGDSEISHLSLIEVDGHGTPIATVRWDEEDLAAAYAELDARFFAGEGTAEPHVLRAIRATGEAWRKRDWDALAACCAPGFVYSDHRVLGFGEILDDPQKWAHSQRVLVELAPDADTRVDHIRFSSRGALRQLTQLGTRDGGAFATSFLSVLSVDPRGRVERMDVYDLDRYDEARAHFDALTTDAPSSSAFANAATRFNERFLRYWDARDWDAIRAMHRPTCEVDDRRQLMKLESPAEDTFRFFFDQPNSRWTVTPIATRGERLALSRIELECDVDEEGGAASIDYLVIDDVDLDGFSTAMVTFDPDDLDAAFTELDARWLASLGTGPEMPFLRDFSAALARRDWDGVASCYASEFVGEDHRLVSWGTLRGPFGFVRALQEMVALAPDAVMRMNHVRVSSRGSLHDATWSGTRDGGAFESPFVSVNEFDAVGKVVRNEFYDPKHIDRALARFDALTTTAASTAHPFANRATRAFDQQIRYFSERNWSGFADLLPTGFRYLDRRRVAQLELNADEFIEFIRPLGEMASTRLFAEVLATRGDRLALVAMHFEGAGGDIGPSAIDDISVVEADARGHIVERVRFDAEDLDAAYAELEARWRAGEAAEYPIALTSLRNFGIALARRDWEAIAACFAAGFVGEDHRLVGWGRLHGPARFADTMREMIALAPDAEVQTHHLRVSTRAILFEAAWVGSRDGGAFESPLVLVVELDALALARRVDVFDLHHLDRALARFGELANAVPPRVLSDLARPNAASEWLIRFQPAFNARDWDRIRDLYAPGVRYEDRQRFSRVSGGLDMLKSSIRERAETGALLERVELVGTAGDRVAAQRVLWAGLGSGDRFEMEFLVVQQVDETGRLVVTVNFDADDTRAAQREMWARWAAIEPHVAAFTTPFGAWIDAFNAGDRDGWRAQFADDLVVDDHRRTGFGRLDGADAYADSLAVLQELAPETQIEAGWHWLAYDRHRAIASVRRTGVIPDGGEFESEYLNLFTVSDGKITQIELFEVDAADAALARFEQLRADPLRVPTNAATRALEPMARLIADRDLEALRALTTDDFCFDDRSKRAQLRGGVEEWLRALQFLRSEIRGQNESHLLAAPGDRLALARVVWRESSGDSPFLIENYRLTEVDASGRLRALVLFDPDDRAAAHDELFERWVATGGVPEGWSEMIRGMNAHDLERVRAALPVDVVIDDHRRTGYGRLEGIDAFLESLAAVFELSPDARWDTRYRIADGPHGFLDLNCMWGTNAEGGDFESPFIALQLYRGGRLHDGEMFEVDHFDEALARFEALRPDPHAEPSTAATRVRDRIAAAFPRRDWDALRALVAADFVYDDRGKRALVCGDVDTWIDSMKFNAQPGFHAGSTPIGAIGDRLALDHVVWFGKPGGDAFEIERIRVLDVDAEGKLRAAIFFDPDDRAAAFAQAQACFLAGEGAVVGGQEPTARVFSAFDAGDWAGLRAVMAPDASFHDHRRLGLGALDVDVWIDSLRALGELTTDLKFEEIRTLACNRHGRVMMGRTRGTNPEGGPFENVFVLVHRSRGDQLLNHEVFDPEDAARALARFEQLCAERGEPDS
jgi:ketosteroid isomerase-like protein/tetratricopeptide (TPR) repeat protein